MSENVLDLIKASARIDEEAGKAVPQIVHAQIRHAGSISCCIPRNVDSVEWLKGVGIGNEIWTLIKTRQTFKDFNYCI